MALVGLVGLSYLLEPSPFNLIARLATGDATAAPTALLYLLPLGFFLALALVFLAALIGADIATVPFKVLQQAFKHALTDSGLERFLSDWEKVKKLV